MNILAGLAAAGAVLLWLPVAGGLRRGLRLAALLALLPLAGAGAASGQLAPAGLWALGLLFFALGLESWLRRAEHDAARAAADAAADRAEQEALGARRQDLLEEIAGLRRQIEGEKQLYEGGRLLAPVIELEDFLRLGRQILARHLRFSWGRLLLLDPRQSGRVEEARDLADGRELDGRESGDWGEAVAQVLEQRVAVLGVAEAPGATWPPGTAGLVGLGFQAGEERRGVLLLGLDQAAAAAAGKWGGGGLRLLRQQFSLALQQVLLYRQIALLSRSDQLTGISKRWFFLERLREELALASHQRRDLVLIIADIDFFKNLNDRYGHLAGDRVLQEVAGRLKKQLRGEDLCGRYGGEEFIIALPENDAAGGVVVAERLRQEVAEREFTVEERRLAVTISLGVAAFPVHAADLTGLIQAADQQLYRAKRGGRNRVCLPEPGPAGPPAA